MQQEDKKGIKEAYQEVVNAIKKLLEDAGENGMLKFNSGEPNEITKGSSCAL